MLERCLQPVGSIDQRCGDGGFIGECRSEARGQNRAILHERLDDALVSPEHWLADVKGEQPVASHDGG